MYIEFIRSQLPHPEGVSTKSPGAGPLPGLFPFPSWGKEEERVGLGRRGHLFNPARPEPPDPKRRSKQGWESWVWQVPLDTSSFSLPVHVLFSQPWVLPAINLFLLFLYKVASWGTEYKWGSSGEIGYRKDTCWRTFFCPKVLHFRDPHQPQPPMKILQVFMREAVATTPKHKG